MLLGFVLYFMSDKVQFLSNTMSNKILRFFTIEHGFGMLISISLITIGYIKFKKQGEHKKIYTYYLIAGIIIFITIPWPFRDLGTFWI